MSNKLVYPAVFTEDGDYIFVKFPDVHGAFTQGSDVSEAYEKAEEILEITLAHSDSIPSPSSIIDISKLHPHSNVVLIGVDSDILKRRNRYNTVRRNISIPEWLNDLVNDSDINVSKVVTEALKKELKVK